MSIIEIKEYDTLRIACEYQDPVDTLANVDLYVNMQSVPPMFAGRSAVKPIVNIPMYITELDVLANTFVITTDATHIEPQDYKLDIAFVDKVGGHVITSESLSIKVKTAVTKPPTVMP